MQRVDDAQKHESRRFWCPRCGTLIYDTPVTGFKQIEKPMLVDRVRALVACDCDDGNARRLGIFEAIYKPEERPNSPGETQ
jgi:hypothetical protein